MEASVERRVVWFSKYQISWPIVSKKVDRSIREKGKMEDVKEKHSQSTATIELEYKI